MKYQEKGYEGRDTEEEVSYSEYIWKKDWDNKEKKNDTNKEINRE